MHAVGTAHTNAATSTPPSMDVTAKSATVLSMSPVRLLLASRIVAERWQLPVRAAQLRSGWLRCWRQERVGSMWIAT
jgi:hypothetical protein